MNIKNNSKNIKKNDIFICTHDEYEDRHKYIDQAIEKGAKAIITDKNIKNKKVPIIKVENTNKTLYQIYNDYYNDPLKNINTIAITGTDGKTSTALIIKNLLDNYTKTAYMGTNGFIYKDNHIKMNNTTPEIKEILKNAKILKDNQINNLVMEASSEALLHNRCEGLLFDRAILTNITGDHLNAHKNFQNYLESKLKLFTKLKENGIAIINIDDQNSDKVIKILKQNNKKYITYAKNKKADFYIKDIKEENNKTTYKLIHNKKEYKVTSSLLGIYNTYNLTAAIATLTTYNYKINDIINNIYNIKEIPGRTNIMYDKKYKVILDYAHTINATKNILDYANKIKKTRIITVVGCAGGREHEKRPILGKIITTLSDYVIFTTDDPRYEKVTDIIKDITKNVEKNNYKTIINRKKAIKYAIKSAKENDIILVLGKGIDNYMAIKHKYKKYCEKDVIEKILKKK